MFNQSAENFWQINSRNNYTIKENGFVYLLWDADRERFFELMTRYDNYDSLRTCSANPFCPENICANPRCSFQIERVPFLGVLRIIKKSLGNLGLSGSFFPRIEEIIDELMEKLEQSGVEYVTFLSHDHHP
jgi:hypothetical protein